MNEKNLFLWLGAATTFVICGSAMMGLTLAIDEWRVGEFMLRNMSHRYHQGLLKECVKNGTVWNCYSWKNSVSFDELLEYQELLQYIVAASSIIGGLSVLLSILEMTSIQPKFVMPVTTLELVSALLGFTSFIIYTIKFVKNPWYPGISYHCLWAGSVLISSGLTIHVWRRDVKFCGKTCCTQEIRPNRLLN